MDNYNFCKHFVRSQSLRAFTAQSVGSILTYITGFEVLLKISFFKMFIKSGFIVFLCISVHISPWNVFGQDCSLLINEINVATPETIKNRDFIELKMKCSTPRKSDSLQGYKILGISAGNDVKKNKQVMSINLIANLWNEKLIGEYFTIGTNEVNANMNPKSPFLTFRNKFTGNSQTLQSFLNKDQAHLHAIVVVYKKGHSFPELVLSNRKPFIPIDDDILNVIKLNVIDLIVYARKSPFDNCELFVNICEDYANKRYILREFDNKNKDRTLSRCSYDGIAFTPEKFKLSEPTPAGDNDCSGPNFILEEHLLAPSNSFLSKTFDFDNIDENNAIQEQNDSPQCTASFDASAYDNIDDQFIEARIEAENVLSSSSSCSALNLGANSGNIANEADFLISRKRQLNEAAEDDSEWATTEFFE